MVIATSEIVSQVHTDFCVFQHHAKLFISGQEMKVCAGIVEISKHAKHTDIARSTAQDVAAKDKTTGLAARGELKLLVERPRLLHGSTHDKTS